LRTLEVAEDTYREVRAKIARAIAGHHQKHPLVRGMPAQDAREAAGIANGRLFAEVVESMDDVAADGPLLRMATHVVALSLEDEAARDILLEQLRASGFSPPTLTSLIEQHGEALVRALIDAGALVKINEWLVVSSEQLDDAKRRIAECTALEGPLTAARIKELLGTSRKFAIPLLEHLDATGFTRRRGDVRELVG
jgi:selenocysteine-specific elongation factor